MGVVTRNTKRKFLTLQRNESHHTLVLILFPPSSCILANALLTMMARIPRVKSARAYFSARDKERVKALAEGDTELKAKTIPMRVKQLRTNANRRRRGEELRRLVCNQVNNSFPLIHNAPDDKEEATHGEDNLCR